MKSLILISFLCALAASTSHADQSQEITSIAKVEGYIDAIQLNLQGKDISCLPFDYIMRDIVRADKVVVDANEQPSLRLRFKDNPSLEIRVFTSENQQDIVSIQRAVTETTLINDGSLVEPSISYSKETKVTGACKFR